AHSYAAQRQDHNAADDPAKKTDGTEVHEGYWQQVFILRNEPEQCGHEGSDAAKTQADGKAREAGFDRTIRVLEQRVADDGDGQSCMPKPIQPNGGLQSRAQDAGRRERSRERQRMRDDDQGREQVAARNDQERPLAQDEELSEQESGGDAVADKKRGGQRGYECVDLRQTNGFQTPCGGKENNQKQPEK